MQHQNYFLKSILLSIFLFDCFLTCVLLLLYSMYRNASIKRPGRLLNSISLFEGGRLIEALQYEKSNV